MTPEADLTTTAYNNDVDHLDPFVFAIAMKLLGRQGLVDLLLKKDCRVIQRGNVLHMAVAQMRWSVVIEKLLALGAKASDKNAQGNTALHLAFINGETDGLVDLLLNDFGLDETTVNVQNNDGLSFSHIACTRSSVEFLHQFIDRGVDINHQVDLRSLSKYAGYTHLHFAVLFGRHKTAALLLRNGASIYVQDHTASTPVHLALKNGDQRMIDILFAHDQRKENYINNLGMTHFMAACVSSVLNVAEEFLHQQPMAFQRVNARVRDVKDHPFAGYSPIHFATEFGSLETVQLLFDYGASSYSLTTNNYSPMALALMARRQNIFLFLQKISTRRDEIFLINKISGMEDNHKWPSF